MKGVKIMKKYKKPVIKPVKLPAALVVEQAYQ